MNRNIYIRSVSAISPQNSFGENFSLEQPVTYSSNRLQTVEPDYTRFIDAKSLRRMSRIIKMGVATAMACLQDAGEKDPGAIITGTAYGCLEDTGIFLTQLTERKEESPPPTPFIQSTHNTIGAQIALILKCHNYNNTFVHRGFSFETALLDAILLLKEEEANTVLVGSADELTNTSFSILNRFGLYREEPVVNLDLYTKPAKGTIAGEGCAFFLLSHEPHADAYAKLDAIHTFYKPAREEIEDQVRSFLESNSVNVNDIDLFITGRNGDMEGDAIYDVVEKSVFCNRQTIGFKHLCGEYPTAVSFALWMGANIIKRDGVKKILIYNHYMGKYHSLVLLGG